MKKSHLTLGQRYQIQTYKESGETQTALAEMILKESVESCSATRTRGGVIGCLHFSAVGDQERMLKTSPKANWLTVNSHIQVAGMFFLYKKSRYNPPNAES